MECTKKVVIVTNTRGSSLGCFLRENLESVLSGYAVIENHFIDELDSSNTLDADAVLVMNKLKAKEVAPYVSDPDRLLVVQRTIKESEVYPLCSIPTGTKVLVVNDTPETTQELAALLYKLEINTLQLVIYEDGVEYPDIRIAITPGESWRVPTSVSSVIDLGHRYIDITTFVKLVSMLKIPDGEISRRILKYSENLVDLDSGIKAQYRELFLKNVELDAVVNLSHEGILLLDNAGMIILYNKSLAGMLGLRIDIRGMPAEDVMPHGMVLMMSQERVEDEIFEYKGRSFLINKRSIEHFGEKAGSYCNIQEVTYIRQLEQNLSRKLQQKGQLARYSFEDILTCSAEMHKCIDLAKDIARSDLSVLITGESGTGKELLAQSIHSASDRAKQPFVAFNCAAVSDSLMESELFGYEGGSFTGALKEGKAGLFEQAHHGTVLLDEIGDMPPHLQVKILRVLQERQIMRVGSQRVTNVDLRIVAATNHDLRRQIKDGTFREDLYYRLNVLPLRVPPLRERSGDVLFLLNHFLRQGGRNDFEISPEAEKVLLAWKWPGNIRELANVASYISFMVHGPISVDQLPHFLIDERDGFESERQEISRRYDPDTALAVLDALATPHGRKTGAGRNTIRELLVNYGYRLTEGETRTLLVVLAASGLISSSIGRKGSEITLKGEAFRRWARSA